LKDIKLRIATLPPPKGSSSYPLTISAAPQAPILVLEQLTAARTLINACLDVVDASSWAGDPKDAHFIAGQLRLLDVNVQEAKNALKGGTEMQAPWWHNPIDDNVGSQFTLGSYNAHWTQIFEPPLPPLVSFHLGILEAALLLEIRTLEPTSGSTSDFNSALSFRDRLAVALGAPRPPTHDEGNEVFTFKGQEVRVREKVRVESQDPSLMAAMAKLNALERSVALARKALNMVMDNDEF
jgi:Rogdi leucine zipper containing protein